MANTKKPRKSYGSKFTPEQKAEYFAAQRSEQAEMLAQAVDTLTSEEGWLRYLNSRARFHKYSFNNTILIALQKPEATQVGSAKLWRDEFKRHITKGEKAIKVLGPVMVAQRDENGAVKKDDNGKTLQKCVGFKWVPTFDVSQTEGEPVPTVEYQSVEGESHEEYLYRAEALWKYMDYEVEYVALDQSHGGDVDMDAKKVRINGARALNGQVRTHIHELAHAIGTVDYTAYTRQQAEVIVESAAYIATAMVGLDTAGMSVPYVATWGAEAEDPKAALKIMRDFAEKIDELAAAIVEGVS